MAATDAAIEGVAGAVGSLIAISATYPLLQVRLPSARGAGVVQPPRGVPVMRPVPCTRQLGVTTRIPMHILLNSARYSWC